MTQLDIIRSPYLNIKDKTMTHSVQNRQASGYPILSIDGGGVRGIIPATMLVEVEKITKKPISDLFRLIGGTSTGGILALGLAMPKGDGTPKFSAQDLLNLYTDPISTTQIFQKNPAYQEPDPRQRFFDRAVQVIATPKYLSPTVVFNDKFQDKLVSDALTDVLITANSVEGVAGRVAGLGLGGLSMAATFLAAVVEEEIPFITPDFFPKTIQLFTTKGMKTLSFSLNNLTREHCKYLMSPLSNNHFYMRHVAQVTSAAPSYFPFVPYRNLKLLDGGCLQNNPAVPCVLEALENKVPLKDMLVVSLGTGETRDFRDPISCFFEMTQPQLAEDRALDVLVEGRHFRFQHYFNGEPPHLDDCRAETIANLKDAGKGVVDAAQENDMLRALCKRLDPEM